MNKPNDAERDKLLQILKDTAAKLSEHFDTVQIFTSNTEEGGDSFVGLKYGSGNYFARFGQVKEWVVEKEAYMAAKGANDFHDDIREEDEE